MAFHEAAGRPRDPDPSRVARAVDVAARREADATVAESERFLRTVLDTSLDAFWVVDGEGRLLDVNPAYCAMSGYAREELLAMRIPDVEALEAEEDTARRIQALQEAGVGRFETTHRRRDGSLLHLDVSVTRVGEAPGLFICFLRDVTGRRLADARLRESEYRYRGLVDNLNAGVLVHGPDGRIALANAKAAFLFGAPAERLVGRRYDDRAWTCWREDGTSMPADEHPVARATATRRPVVNAVVGVDAAGVALRAWLLVSAHPEFQPDGALQRVVATFTDIGRRKEAEEALRRSQADLAIATRVAAMGTLVGGLAHEVNNPLAAALAGQATAQDDLRAVLAGLDDGRPVDPAAVRTRLERALEALDDAQIGTRRVARIVKEMSTFGRPDPRRVRVALAEIVDGALRRVPAVRPDVTVAFESAASAQVQASPGQLEQVLVNLLTNAFRAFPPEGQGRVEVACGEGPGAIAWIEVRDDGVGIAPEILPRIFDPFFTTRPVGDERGTGLGLAICHAIVVAHGGALTVRSAPGKGSTFRIELPRAAPGR